MVLEHFRRNHSQSETGRFTVPLPCIPEQRLLSESCSLAVRRFLTLEKALWYKGEFEALDAVIQEYFQLKHAEPVPIKDLDKTLNQVYYLPIHAVKKESSSTTKIRAVFDVSAKSSSGVSLNDTLLVGPTIHSSLINVLLSFRIHPVALTET